MTERLAFLFFFFIKMSLGVLKSAIQTKHIIIIMTSIHLTQKIMVLKDELSFPEWINIF